MKKMYMGFKIVYAEPVYKVETNNASSLEYQDIYNGYAVTYQDGYKSFSPKNVFEKAYLEISVNPNLKTDKPSISQQMVDDFIKEVYIYTLGEKTTVVRAILVNGFELVESSSCVSVENYDENTGKEICLNKIKDKIWFLLGFLLQTAVNGVK